MMLMICRAADMNERRIREVRTLRALRSILKPAAKYSRPLNITFNLFADIGRCADISPPLVP